MPKYYSLFQQTAQNNLQPSLSVKINKNLTFQNAEAYGYRWIKDTIFSPIAPTLFEEVKNLIERGYCLGQPSISNASKIYVGLYSPI